MSRMEQSARDTALVKQTVETAVNQGSAQLEELGISPESYKRAAFNALLANPYLLKSNPGTLRKALLDCIQKGLRPNGEQAALVPFKGAVQLIVMHKGMIDLIRRAIPGVTFRSAVVYHCDEFEYEDGMELTLRHVPNLKADPEDRSAQNIVAAWAVAEIPGGSREVAVMGRVELEAIRLRSPSGRKDTSPWNTDRAEMYRKTVIRRLCKTMPQNEIFQLQGHLDDTVHGDEDEEAQAAAPERERIDVTPKKEAAKPKPKSKAKPKPKPEPPPEPEAEDMGDHIQNAAEPEEGDGYDDGYGDGEPGLGIDELPEY